MTKPVPSVQKRQRVKESPEASRREEKKNEGSSVSKLELKPRDKKPKPAFGEQQEKVLIYAHHSLCRPQVTKDQRVQDWLVKTALSEKKAKALTTWLENKAQWFENLEDFNPSQFLTERCSEGLTLQDARLHGDALCNSLSAFNSLESYGVTQELVRIVSRGTIRSAEQLLSDIHQFAAPETQADVLERACGEVGRKNLTIKGLLDVAINVHEQGYDTEAELVHLKNTLARLDQNKASANPARHSAPTGVINIEDVRKQRKAEPPKVSFPETAFKQSESAATEIPVTPRGPVKRDRSSGASSTAVEKAGDTKAAQHESSSESRGADETRSKHTRKHRRNRSRVQDDPPAKEVASAGKPAGTGTESPPAPVESRPLPKPDSKLNVKAEAISRSTSGPDEGDSPDKAQTTGEYTSRSPQGRKLPPGAVQMPGFSFKPPSHVANT